MKSNISISSLEEQIRNTIDNAEDHFCYNCRRRVGELEPFSADIAEKIQKDKDRIGKDLFSQIYTPMVMAQYTLRKTKRSGGTYTWGSSWECKDCIILPDHVATIQSNDAYLCELIEQIYDLAGFDYLSQIFDQKHTQHQSEIFQKELKLMASNKEETDINSFSSIEWAIKNNMLTKQEVGLETVFIINGPPADAVCMLCGKSVDQLSPFDQGFVDEMKQTEKKIAGDVEVTHCVCPYMAEGNRLAKRCLPLGEEGVLTTWECTDCVSLPREEALERYYAVLNR